MRDGEAMAYVFHSSKRVCGQMHLGYWSASEKRLTLVASVFCVT